MATSKMNNRNVVDERVNFFESQTPKERIGNRECDNMLCKLFMR